MFLKATSHGLLSSRSFVWFLSHTRGISAQRHCWSHRFGTPLLEVSGRFVPFITGIESGRPSSGSVWSLSGSTSTKARKVRFGFAAATNSNLLFYSLNFVGPFWARFLTFWILRVGFWVSLLCLASTSWQDGALPIFDRFETWLPRRLHPSFGSLRSFSAVVVPRLLASSFLSDRKSLIFVAGPKARTIDFACHHRLLAWSAEGRSRRTAPWRQTFPQKSWFGPEDFESGPVTRLVWSLGFGVTSLIVRRRKLAVSAMKSLVLATRSVWR